MFQPGLCSCAVFFCMLENSWLELAFLINNTNVDSRLKPKLWCTILVVSYLQTWLNLL